MLELLLLAAAIGGVWWYHSKYQAASSAVVSGVTVGVTVMAGDANVGVGSAGHNVVFSLPAGALGWASMARGTTSPASMSGTAPITVPPKAGMIVLVWNDASNALQTTSYNVQ